MTGTDGVWIERKPIRFRETRSSPSLQRYAIAGDGLCVIPDARVAGGFLAGLCTAFSAIQDCWVLQLACDLPLIEPVLPERLLANRAAGIDAVTFRRDNDMPTDRMLSPSCHASCALYHARMASAQMPLNRRP